MLLTFDAAIPFIYFFSINDKLFKTKLLIKNIIICILNIIIYYIYIVIAQNKIIKLLYYT